MIDIGSINSVSVDTIPTSNLSWGGHFSDRLIENMPVGLAANLIPFVMIAIALFIIAQKNAIDLTLKFRFGWPKFMGMLALFSTALYSTIQSTSTVFLYFNF
jgi:hypothetical protein